MTKRRERFPTKRKSNFLCWNFFLRSQHSCSCLLPTHELIKITERIPCGMNCLQFSISHRLFFPPLLHVKIWMFQQHKSDEKLYNVNEKFYIKIEIFFELIILAENSSNAYQTTRKGEFIKIHILFILAKVKVKPSHTSFARALKFLEKLVDWLKQRRKTLGLQYTRALLRWSENRKTRGEAFCFLWYIRDERERQRRRAEKLTFSPFVPSSRGGFSSSDIFTVLKNQQNQTLATKNSFEKFSIKTISLKISVFVDEGSVRNEMTSYKSTLSRFGFS